MSQKVVIPRGMLNPNEVTVIEIPPELKSVDTVIIKAKSRHDTGPRPASSSPKSFGFSGSKLGARVSFQQGPVETGATRRPKTAPMASIMFEKQLTELSERLNLYKRKMDVEVGDHVKDGEATATENDDYNGDETPSLNTKLKNMLDIVENFEYEKIKKDLRDFQTARRKLVVNTTNLTAKTCFTVL